MEVRTSCHVRDIWHLQSHHTANVTATATGTLHNITPVVHETTHTRAHVHIKSQFQASWNQPWNVLPPKFTPLYTPTPPTPTTHLLCVQNSSSSSQPPPSQPLHPHLFLPQRFKFLRQFLATSSAETSVRKQMLSKGTSPWPKPQHNQTRQTRRKME